MDNPEDIRKRFLQRPQRIREEKATENRRLEAERIEQEATGRAYVAQQQREKDERLQNRRARIQEVYESMAIKQRVAAIASIISGGRILLGTEEVDKIYVGGIWNPYLERSIAHFHIPYHTFTARKIIKDPRLSTPGSTGGMGGYYPGATGQKLSEPAQLVDYLGVAISVDTEHYNKPTEDNIQINFRHVRWQEEEMWWTKAINSKKGWVEKIRVDSNQGYRLINGQFESGSSSISLVRAIDSSFNQIYDDYLAATGQV